MPTSLLRYPTLVNCLSPVLVVPHSFMAWTFLLFFVPALLSTAVRLVDFQVAEFQFLYWVISVELCWAGCSTTTTAKRREAMYRSNSWVCWLAYVCVICTNLDSIHRHTFGNSYGRWEAFVCAQPMDWAKYYNSPAIVQYACVLIQWQASVILTNVPGPLRTVVLLAHGQVWAWISPLPQTEHNMTVSGRSHWTTLKVCPRH